MTAAEKKVLDALIAKGPLTCAMVGDNVWAAPRREGRDHARTAGKVLKGLEARGLVRRINGKDRTVFEAAGRRKQ